MLSHIIQQFVVCIPVYQQWASLSWQSLLSVPHHFVLMTEPSIKQKENHILNPFIQKKSTHFHLYNSKYLNPPTRTLYLLSIVFVGDFSLIVYHSCISLEKNNTTTFSFHTKNRVLCICNSDLLIQF